MADVRPIDANALLTKAHNYYPSMDHYCFSRHAVDAKDIEAAPILDYVPVKHGEWMIHHYNSETYEYEDIPYNQATFDNPSGTLFCSACGAEALLNAHEEDVPSKYCPNCGAKMDGGKRNV